MKMELLSKVTDIRLTFSVQEALAIAGNPKKGERIREELEAGLRGAGVDPDTGQIVGSSLGLDVDLGPGVRQLTDGDAGKKPEPVKKKTRAPRAKVKCDICGEEFSARGVNVHKALKHGIKQETSESDDAPPTDEPDEVDELLDELDAISDDAEGVDREAEENVAEADGLYHRH